MPKYKIAWLPGDGIGIEVLEAARSILDKLNFDATYLPGDIGWECWRNEGDPFPQRTIELLKDVDAALFGAITSKPAKVAETELVPRPSGKGLCLSLSDCSDAPTFRSLYLSSPLQGFPGEPSELEGGHRPRRLP